MAIFDQNNISFDVLVRFAFGEMSADDEQAVEQLLEENPHLADTVDGILRFALDRDLKNRQDFEQAWESEMELTRASVSQGDTAKKKDEPPPVPGMKWYLLAGLTVVLVGAVIWLMESSKKEDAIPDPGNKHPDTLQSTPLSQPEKEDSMRVTPPDSPGRIQKKRPAPLPQDRLPELWRPDSSGQAALLRYFWDFEQEKLRVAGGSEQSWGKPFREQDYPGTLKILEARIQNGAASIREYYMAGVLACLLYRPDDAIQWLRKAEGNITRPALSLYLALALAQKGDRQAAREQLAKTPADLLKEQPESLRAWLRGK